MSGFSNPLVGGGGGLVYPSIHSPGFAAGPPISGWSINKNGDAYFGNLALSGTFSGTDWEINNDGAFFYSGTPAAGNLILSVAAAAGTDAYGNAYLAGTVSYTPVSGIGFYAQANIFGQTHYYAAATEAGPWTLAASAGLTNDSILGNLLFFGGDSAAPGNATTYCTPWGLAAAEPGGEAEGWHDFGLQNGFTAGADANGTAYPPGYMLLPDGRVALRGELITPPSPDTVLGVTFGVVNPGYRPTTNIPTATITNDTGSAAGTVYIRPDGNVQLAGAFGNSFNVRLDCTINVQGT